MSSTRPIRVKASRTAFQASDERMVGLVVWAVSLREYILMRLKYYFDKPINPAEICEKFEAPSVSFENLSGELFLIIPHLGQNGKAFGGIFADKIGNLDEEAFIELKSGDISAKEGELGFVLRIRTHIPPIVCLDIGQIGGYEDIFVWFEQGVF